MNGLSVRRLLTVLLFMCLLPSCQGCDSDSPSTDADSDGQAVRIVRRDFDAIRKDGTLRAVAKYSSTSYFIYRGRPMGFEYELLRWLAKHLDLNLEIHVENDLKKAQQMLNSGEVDIIAYGLTLTLDRKDDFLFTEPYTQTEQVLVQRKPEHWRRMKQHKIDATLIRNPVDLIGKTVKVREDSSYYQRIVHLSHELGGKIHIETAPSWMLTEDLIKEVAEGTTEYTVSDRNIAVVNRSYYPILDVRTKISFPQRIAWALRKNAPAFRDKVNRWIRKIHQYDAYYTIYNKYYRNQRSIRTRGGSEFHSKTGGKISRYDDLIKKYGKRIDWDWRLLASMIYQESKFNPWAESWTDATGLMQIIPKTADQLGVIDLTDPHQNIWAGTLFIRKLQKQFTAISDPEERRKFVLASYNTGKGHVDDAMRLAEKNGKNPLVWDNVAEYLLKLSNSRFYYDPVVKYGYCRGSEPYRYVKEILERYDQYRKFITGDDEAPDVDGMTGSDAVPDTDAADLHDMDDAVPDS